MGKNNSKLVKDQSECDSPFPFFLPHKNLLVTTEAGTHIYEHPGAFTLCFRLGASDRVSVLGMESLASLSRTGKSPSGRFILAGTGRNKALVVTTTGELYPLGETGLSDALVELYRRTKDKHYLGLALQFLQ